MEPGNKLVDGVELQFGTRTLDERQPDGLVVNIGIKMKNIHLDGAMRPVADGGTYAYVQHSFVPFPVEIYPYGIHSVGRNQLVGVVYAQVGGGKADFSRSE